jgi:C-terminal processing protease CtpA/Prc
MNLFQRCVVVQEVFPEGLVSQDGRLKPGDQLIEINGIDMTTASHHQVSVNTHMSRTDNTGAHSAAVQWLRLAFFLQAKSACS